MNLTKWQDFNIGWAFIFMSLIYGYIFPFDGNGLNAMGMTLIVLFGAFFLGRADANENE